MLTHNITLYMKTSIVLKVIEKYSNALEIYLVYRVCCLKYYEFEQKHFISFSLRFNSMTSTFVASLVTKMSVDQRLRRRESMCAAT